MLKDTLHRKPQTEDSDPILNVQCEHKSKLFSLLYGEHNLFNNIKRQKIPKCTKILTWKRHRKRYCTTTYPVRNHDDRAEDTQGKVKEYIT